VKGDELEPEHESYDKSVISPGPHISSRWGQMTRRKEKKRKRGL
jgi:hypothetical protein